MALDRFPNDTFAAFARYTFPPDSVLADPGVGGGVRYLGPTFADDQNTFRSKGVTLFDGVIDYEFARLNPRYAGFRQQAEALAANEF